jgi:Flp pilus assembly protein TadD
LEDAVAQYEEALRLGPDNAQAQCNLGNALDSLGRTQDAISHYVEALRLKPDDATIHLNLAIVLLKIVGREGEAVAQLREALALQPDNQLARRMLGRVSPPGP